MQVTFYDPKRKITTDELKRQLQHKSSHATRSIWINESFFCYIVLQNDQAAPIRLNLSPTNGESFVVMYFVAQQNVASLGRGTTARYIDPKIPKETVYDCLKPQTSLTLQAGESKLIACKLIHTNKKASPFVVELFQELQLQVNVHDRNIQELSNELFELEIWQYPHSVAHYYGIQKEDYFKQEHERLVKQSLDAYQQAGGSVMIAGIVDEPWNHQTFGEYPSLVEWFYRDGTFTFDFSNLLTYLNWNRESVIKGKLKLFSPLPWNNQITYYNEAHQIVSEKLEVGSAKWYGIWESFIIALIDCLKQYDKEQDFYLAFDERAWDDVLHVIELKNRVGTNVKLSAAIDSNLLENPLLDQIEDVSISQSQTRDKMCIMNKIRERSKKGLTTSIYNCTGHFPSLFARSWNVEGAFLLWYICSLGADGFLRWALDAWTQLPLEDSSHWFFESGDCFLLYPHHNDDPIESVYPTFRWITLQETILAIKKYRFFLKHDSKKVYALTDLLSELVLPSGMTNEFGAMEASDPSQLEEMVQTVLTISSLLEEL